MHDFAVSEGLIFWCSISSPRLHQYIDSHQALGTLEMALIVGGCQNSFFIATRPPATFFLTDLYCQLLPRDIREFKHDYENNNHSDTVLASLPLSSSHVAKG